MPTSTKLTWHNNGDNEFEAGVSDVALYVMNNNGTYGTGIAWNGVTAINENPSGADATDLYADNVKYATLRSAEKFGFTIEAYTYPDEWAECDGSAEASPGVYLGQQNRKAFGLVYKTKIGDDTHPGMDKGFKLHIVYKCTASPSGRGYTTINENPDAISMSWEATSTPIPVSGYKDCSTITIDSTKADSTKLTALLEKFYGDENGTNTPSLIDPATVISSLAASTTP